MTHLQQLELVILLLVVVVGLTTVAARVLIPYPILLVLGGLVLALLPQVPPFPLDPDLVFLVFLPPILWSAAYFTSLREFRANLVPISALAFGLVIATTAAVALVAHAIFPTMGWAAAVTLGAVVSPPDAVAATAVMRRFAIPRRIVTVLEGESLVNDATALVLYRAAVAAAATTGVFVLRDAFMQFAFAAAAGVAVGLVVGAAMRLAFRLIRDTFSEIAITLLAPYVAWALAERLGASAVLACVAGGFYVRTYFSALVAPATRMQAHAVWELVVFILNGIIFIMIGLQLDVLRHALAPGELIPILWLGIMVSATVILVRLCWVPIVAYVPRWMRPRRARGPAPHGSEVVLESWIGMRGIVSLASALALPLTRGIGHPFPFRTEIILVAFIVILVTLVLQGLSIAPLLRRLHFRSDDTLDREEAHARAEATEAALHRLHVLTREGWAPPDELEGLRLYYHERQRRTASAERTAGSSQSTDAYRRLRHEALMAERARLIQLRNRGEISDDILQRLEFELDVEALRIGTGETRMRGAS